MSSSAMLLAVFALAPVSTAAASQEEPPKGVIIYRSETGGRAFAFSPKAEDFKAFYGPYRSTIWQSDIGGYFKMQKERGIRYERFTGVSLPDDLESTSRWQVEGQQCAATQFTGDRWLVQCNGDVDLSYIYKKHTGIIGLTSPCDEQRVFCWYDLKTETGLFSDEQQNLDR